MTMLKICFISNLHILVQPEVRNSYNGILSMKSIIKYFFAFLVLVTLLIWKIKYYKIVDFNETTTNHPLNWVNNLSGSKIIIGKHRSIDEIKKDTFEIDQIRYKQNLEPKYYLADKYVYVKRH